MAENLRGLLSDTDEQNIKLHGRKNDHIQKHDVHLVGDIFLCIMVGKVRTYNNLFILECYETCRGGLGELSIWVWEGRKCG